MRHLLIVDDEEAITYLFQLFFEDLGYRVSVASNGVEALDVDTSDAADAVLTDLTMPGMSGRELIHALRARHPGIPAIVITGWSGAEDLTDINTTVMHKPVDLDTVSECLANLIPGGAP